MSEGVRELKNGALSLLTGLDAEEAGFYFDYLIGALA
jgi:allophycocyanin alpha subunit